jgi:hypothetical protein
MIVVSRVGSYLVAVLAVSAAVTVAVAQAHPRVVLQENLSFKPHELSISGDGDWFVRRLSWHSWGGKTAVATGQAILQDRPSHVNHFVKTRVTLSDRTFCKRLHRTVYNKVTSRLLGAVPKSVPERTLGRVYTCSGTWRLVT